MSADIATPLPDVQAAPVLAERPLRGVLLVVLAVFLFALADIVTKHLTQLYPVTTVIGGRYFANFLLLFVALYPSRRARLWQTTRTWLVLIRGVVLAAMSLTLALALRLLPVGETVAIMYLAPFAVMIFARPILGERVSLMGWVGAVLGFSGVLLVLRPGGGLDPVGVMWALANAGLATVYHLMTRFLSKTERPAAMMFHVALIGSILMAGLLVADPPKQWPVPVDMGLIIILGFCTGAGHLMLTAAYREAPASLLAPVNYLHLFWGAGFGWLFFGHLPDVLTVSGMVLVGFAGLLIAVRARRA